MIFNYYLLNTKDKTLKKIDLDGSLTMAELKVISDCLRLLDYELRAEVKK